MQFSDFEVGKFYRFYYNGKTRHVVVLEKSQWNRTLLCWDFGANGYRSFYYPRSAETLTGFVTDKIDYQFRNQETRSIKTKVHKGTLYALAMN